MTNINPSYWKNLEIELQEKLQTPMKLIFPDRLTKKFMNWYFNIERADFREDLRYTKEELQTRFQYSKRLFFFVIKGRDPIAVLLGYREPNSDSNLFYLDTIATIIAKKGIGASIMKYLINWTKMNGFTGIKLDTELSTERGILLKTYYEKFGFKVINEDEKGDITMECRF